MVIFWYPVTLSEWIIIAVGICTIWTQWYNCNCNCNCLDSSNIHVHKSHIIFKKWEEYHYHQTIILSTCSYFYNVSRHHFCVNILN